MHFRPSKTIGFVVGLLLGLLLATTIACSGPIASWTGRHNQGSTSNPGSETRKENPSTQSNKTEGHPDNKNAPKDASKVDSAAAKPHPHGVRSSELKKANKPANVAGTYLTCFEVNYIDSNGAVISEEAEEIGCDLYSENKRLEGSVKPKSAAVLHEPFESRQVEPQTNAQYPAVAKNLHHFYFSVPKGTRDTVIKISAYSLFYQPNETSGGDSQKKIQVEFASTDGAHSPLLAISPTATSAPNSGSQNSGGSVPPDKPDANPTPIPSPPPENDFKKILLKLFESALPVYSCGFLSLQDAEALGPTKAVLTHVVREGLFPTRDEFSRGARSAVCEDVPNGSAAYIKNIKDGTEKNSEGVVRCQCGPGERLFTYSVINKTAGETCTLRCVPLTKLP